MGHKNTVFSQLMKLVPRHEFEKQANKHHVGQRFRKVRRWDQFGALVLSQLSGKQSLRDIEANLDIQEPLLYHSGMKKISKSSLARLNEQQPAECFESLFYQMVNRFKSHRPKHRFRFNNPLYSMDASLIDLSLKIFPWADINGRGKAALKLHVGLNHGGYLPEFVSVTGGREPDVKAAEHMNFPKGSIIAMDKGYTSFDYYSLLNNKGNFFVTRLKKGISYRTISTQKVSRNSGVISDKRIELCGEKGKNYTDLPLRRIHYHDETTGHHYEFLTNHLKLSAKTIALIYKDRWQVELFFKHIKQNLKIKSFLGKSLNALKSQIWVAMSVQLLLWYLKWSARIAWSIQRMMRVLQVNLFMKYDLVELFVNAPPPDPGDIWIQEAICL